MSELVHVLTPSARRENIPAVRVTLELAAQRAAPLVEVKWHILYDDRREHVGGWGLRNEMLDEIPDDDDAWIWLLDDDTAAHPDILRVFEEHVFRHRLATPTPVDLFLCAQTRPIGWDPGCGDPRLLRYGKEVGPGECAFDAGQAIFRRSVLGSYRFVEGDHDSDGYLWRDVLAHVPLARVVWTHEVLAYYNAFRP